MIYDISQELLSCSVYPGDPKPTLIPLKRMADGALYNLSSLSMCVHNGTHIDAPAHFLADGKTVEQLDISACIGRCYVYRQEGVLSAEDAETICIAAESVDGSSQTASCRSHPARRSGALSCSDGRVYPLCASSQHRGMRGCTVPRGTDRGGLTDVRTLFCPSKSHP